MRLTRGWGTDSGESYRALTADYRIQHHGSSAHPRLPLIGHSLAIQNLPHGAPKVVNFPAVSADEAALTIADTPGCLTGASEHHPSSRTVSAIHLQDGSLRRRSDV
jgi:hypothetical protein